MPPRKEPKETVTYNTASKRKPPPFKPQRPSQVPRVASSESASRPLSRTPSAGVTSTSKSNANAGNRTGSGFAPASSSMFGRVNPGGTKQKARVIDSDDDEEEDIEDEGSGRKNIADRDNSEESDDDLADDPLAAKPRRPNKPAAPAKRKTGRPPEQKEPSPLAISDDEDGLDTAMPEADIAANVPSKSSEMPSLPRPLLLRLMHEHFESKETKIDKHALGVLEKYFEIYMREAIARASLAKKEDVDSGAASQSEERWLEKTDLEKVVAGIVMDF